MQAPMGIPPDFRTNIDFTFILKNNNASDREKIYKNYAGMFPNRVVFDHVLDECTDNYQCLVIDNKFLYIKLVHMIMILELVQILCGK